MVSVAVRPIPVSIENPCPFDMEPVVLSKKQHIELQSQVNYWKAQHARAVQREQALIKQLNEALAKNRDLNQRLFGKKTEKSKPRSDKAFIGKKSDKPRGQQAGSKGHGRTKRGNLQVREETVDFPKGEACCPECHLPFVPHSGTQDADYTEIEVKAYIRRVKRKRYGSSGIWILSSVQV